MPTPVAHLLTGVTLLELSRSVPPRGKSPTHAGRPAERLWLGWILLCAAGPDLDHLASWLFTGDRMAWHRHASHSLAGLVLVALAGTLLFGRSRGAFRAAALSSAAFASHLLLDLVTGPAVGGVPAYGAALLAPLEPAKFHLPFSLIPGIRGIWTLHNLGVVALEAAVFGLPLALLTLLRTRRPASTGIDRQAADPEGGRGSRTEEMSCGA